MKSKHLILIGFVIAFCISSKAQSTFQKYVSLTNSPTYTGIYCDGLGYDPATGSIFVQADRHDGCCSTPPGLIKFDTLGNIVWSRFTNPLGTVWGTQGSYFNGGFSIINRTTSYSGGMTSEIINYDGAGNLTSQTGINTNVSSVVDLNVAGSSRLPNGDILVTGYGPVTNHFKDFFYGRLNSTGGIIWSGYSGDNDSYWENGWGSDYDPTNLDCYFVGQNISFSPTGTTDMHVVKTDINGNVIYTENIGTAGSDVAWAVKVLPNRDLVVIGNSTVSGNERITFTRLSPAGAIVSSCIYNGSGSTNIIRTINTLPNGNLLLTGYTNSFGSGGIDALNMEVDLSGNIIWQKAYGSATTDDELFYGSVIFNNSIFSVGERNFGNSNGQAYQLYLVKTDLTGTFNALGCTSVNGNYVRVPNVAYTVTPALNITPSGINLVCNFTQAPFTTSTVNVCVTPLTATVTSTNVPCFNSCTGTATAIPSGGTSPYTYSWSPSGGTNAVANSLCAGTYTCTITDAALATVTVTVTITQPPSFTASSTATTVNCSIGWANVTATPNGGVGPYTYSWSPSGGTNSTAQEYVAGNYTCTITDANGCTATTIAVVTGGTGPTASLVSSVNNTCFGGTSGSATVIASGGNPGYTYSWSPSGGTGATATGLAAGTYTCIVTESTGCQATVIVIITQPTQVNASITSTATTCGNNNGTANVTASGGTPGYTYSWSPSGGTGSTASSLTTGNYTCTITDANGCIQTATVNIGITGAPTATIQSQADVLCNGGNTGTATISVTGGTPGYNYSWSPSGGNAATASNLSVGNYTCTITDAAGCITTQVVTINQPTILSASTISTDATCGNNDGTATVTATGGTSGYTYSWAPSGGNSANAINLAVGIYTVTITDANGCTTTATANVSSLGGPTTSLQSSTDVLCFGGTNGSATIIASGNGPFTYAWSPTGGNSASATNLSAQTYSVTVTDAGGCITIQTVTINQPTVLASSTSSNAANCGNNNGDATVIVTGGTGPYTYLWNNSQTTSIATALVGGTYSVTITDANGCTSTATVTVGNTGAPTIALQSSTNILCNGASSGAATITATGGQSPYTYAWSPSGGNAATANNLSAGVYTVTVTGSDGCAQTQTVVITQPNPLQITNASTPESCGGSDGTASITVVGGSPSYTYLWSNFDTTASINNLISGSYSVTITDANGCTSTSTVVVSSIGTAVADAGNYVHIYLGNSTTLNGTGGGTYAWSPPSSLSCDTCQNPLASPTVTTTYTVTVTDSLGCTATDTVTVFVDINCGTVWVPNAFSPNADHENDILFVRGNCIKYMDFEVYNRWGEKVFSSTDPLIGWDGTWRTKDCEAAVFTYFLRATLIDDSVLEMQGNISLIK